MMNIYGANTFNPMKVLLTAEELGVKYNFINVDLSKMEHRQPDHLSRNALGKVPVLEHNGETICESAAICRYLSNINQQKLYSSDPLTAAKIDQMVDMLSQHVGRWIGVYFWQEVICKQFFNKEADAKAIEEASKNLKPLLTYLNSLLAKQEFLSGPTVTIADTIGFAYFQVSEITTLEIAQYKNIVRWYGAFKDRPSVDNVKRLMAGK